jgi:hypothetical protein
VIRSRRANWHTQTIPKAVRLAAWMLIVCVVVDVWFV